MAILIRDMELPQTCSECPLLDYDRCKITDECGGIDLPRDENRCPLTEVPPHGRLIDADALCAKADDTIVHSDPVNLVVDIGMAFKYYLKNAPTIIEAEGEDG